MQEAGRGTPALMCPMLPLQETHKAIEQLLPALPLAILSHLPKNPSNIIVTKDAHIYVLKVIPRAGKNIFFDLSVGRYFLGPSPTHSEFAGL